MSKVIVIKSCMECMNQWFNCCTKKRTVMGDYPRVPRDHIPEGCPLPDLPQRKEEMEYLATGWNACLDAIEEES